MTDPILNDLGQIEFGVDMSIYDEHIINKVLYRWAGAHTIARRNIPGTTLQHVTLSASEPIGREKFAEIVRKLSTDFIDYKNRSIIDAETRDLRNILYAKAFANNDDFVEFDF